MAIKVHKLTNCNIYADGENYLGRADEVTLPDITGKMVEHKALGMVGSTEFWAGFEKMELRIKWNAPYADAMKLSANPTVVRQIDVRGSVDSFSSIGRDGQIPFLASMQVQFKKAPGGDFKQHEQVDLETMATVQSIRLELDGEVIHEVDVLANVFKVGGEDILAQYRENLGI